MRLRETADYRSDFSEEGALFVTKRAAEILTCSPEPAF
jgi:hypothetical protein